ncbi:MAG: carbon-nitrogen hydrolase family protein [Pseudomonadota bacterium]
MSTPAPFKVAAVQAAPAHLDIKATVEKTIALIDEAGREGVKFMVFPEVWLPGYPWHIWLGSAAWGMQFIGRYFENSVEAGGPEEHAIGEAAARNGVQVMLGVSEREGGSLYLSQWHFGSDGSVISRRRKLKPTHVERTVYGNGDGSDVFTTETELGRIGALCCWEHIQPLTKFAMYAQHEQIHAAAWPAFSVYPGAAYALGPEVNTAASRLYAVEGSCFVVAACGMVSEEIHTDLCDTEERKQLLHVGGGHARIFGPDGSPLAEPIDPESEGLLIAEIDLSMIAYAKAAADPVGHYSRPDVFKLLHNKTDQRNVIETVSGRDAFGEDAMEDAASETAD